MVVWTDRSARLLFAPAAHVDAPLYIDKLEVECREAVLPHLVTRDVREIRDLLCAGSVFTASDKPYACDVRAGWLFSGGISLRQNRTGPGIKLSLHLILNTTRFLQAHDIPTLPEARTRILADPRRYLRADEGGAPEVQMALDAARTVTLDRSNNFLTDSPANYGPVLHWSQRTGEYIEAVLRLIEQQLRVVTNRLGGHVVSDTLRAANWRIRQVELYWEYGTADAVAKVFSIQRTALAVLRDSTETSYPPRSGFERNSPLIKGQLNHKSIEAVIYAKSARVVRFEVRYKTSPLKFARRALCPKEPGDIDRLCLQLDGIARDAAARGSRFWVEFWGRHDRAGTVSADRIIALVDAVKWAAEGTQIGPAELLSLVIHRDGAEPFTTGRSSRFTDPVKRLKMVGILSKGRHAPTARMRYEVRPEYAALVDTLRDALTAAADAESTTGNDTGLLPSQDAVPTARRRFRPRALRPLNPISDAADDEEDE